MRLFSVELTKKIASAWPVLLYDTSTQLATSGMKMAAFGCAWALFSLLLCARSVFAQQQLATSIDPDVQKAVAADGAAPVVVALSVPRLRQTGPSATKALRAAVQEVQDDVLGIITPSEFRSAHRYRSVPAISVTVTSEAALERLTAHPNVRKIDLDVEGKGGLNASRQLVRGTRWHEVGVEGAGISVAVIDSGIDTGHEALSGNLTHEACFHGSPYQEYQCPGGSGRQVGAGAAEDDEGHGTAVAGIIASAGGRAPKGMAPAAEIVALKVLNAENKFYMSDLIAALDHIISRPELGVRVVNMSLGTFPPLLFQDECDDTTSWNIALASAIRTLRSMGILAVASSMNDGATREMASPACLSGVVSVGATDKNDDLVDYSNRNSLLDVVAPGRGIHTAKRGNKAGRFGGTSAAAPHVAGCAALLLSAVPDATPGQVESALKTSPVRVVDKASRLSFPRLDCFATGELEVPVVPERFVLHGNYPNPFRGVTTIEYDLPERTEVQLEVFDVLGRRVATLEHGEQAAGLYRVQWDTRSNGVPLASGAYFVRLQAAGQTRVEQVVLVR